MFSDAQNFTAETLVQTRRALLLSVAFNQSTFSTICVSPILADLIFERSLPLHTCSQTPLISQLENLTAEITSLSVFGIRWQGGV